MLHDNCNAKRPKPSSLHRSTIFKRCTPELCAIALVPRDSELTPINAQERVIGDIAVVDPVAKLNNSERHWRCSKRKSKKIFIFFKRFHRQSVCVLSECIDFRLWKFCAFTAFAGINNKFAKFGRGNDSHIWSIIKLKSRRSKKYSINTHVCVGDWKCHKLTGSGGTSSSVFVSHDDCKSTSCWSKAAATP